MTGQATDARSLNLGADTNRKVVESYLDALNAQNWESLEDCLTEDLVRHSVATSGPHIKSRSAFIRFLRENAAAFPDLFHEVKMMICEEDLLACYLVMKGTQTGPMGPVPATGRRVDIPFLSFLRIENERIAEMWVEWDNVAFLSQLGLIPEGWPLDAPEPDGELFP